jgi:energy-coupling factor transporter ATP-binding protein EcfA2
LRLKEIKLAGFKSFVDPTHIPIPGHIVGVVGPNGCGKSNLIDAVRWVLGESSARHLRGETMQDVIFNGAGERKPGHRASVELLFDNSLGKAGGEWSSYAEIAIKRVLEREGASEYYINGMHVRRRDVADLFLGTGVGARAYGIIEQGMISQIIEAKPEELRVFLEEAAGVSKYRERRRETELRIGDTRDNLHRVNDIRDELNSQLERLQAQAEVAAKYKELQDALANIHQLLWLVRKQEAMAQGARFARELERLTVETEAEMARAADAQKRAEALRVDFYAASDRVSTAQGGVFSGGLGGGAPRAADPVLARKPQSRASAARAGRAGAAEMRDGAQPVERQHRGLGSAPRNRERGSRAVARIRGRGGRKVAARRGPVSRSAGGGAQRARCAVAEYPGARNSGDPLRACREVVAATRCPRSASGAGT